MAPECALDQPYGLSVDVYSFGILFWQICSLQTPFAGMGTDAHADAVVHGNQRPVPDVSWPMSWVDLMLSCWDSDPKIRPGLDAIVSTLRERLEELEHADGLIPTRANESRMKNKHRHGSATSQDGQARLSSPGDTPVLDAEIV
jgi:serine/threonine protein kinase